MSEYTELIKALRCKSLSKKCDSCKYGYRLCPDSECNDACHVEQIYADAAAAIEALQKTLKAVQTNSGINFRMWEEAQAEVERLQAQLPKQGEIVRCGECAHCYAEGFVHERNICEKHPEFGNVPDDWFCAGGEREVQDGQK